MFIPSLDPLLGFFDHNFFFRCLSFVRLQKEKKFLALFLVRCDTKQKQTQHTKATTHTAQTTLRMSKVDVKVVLLGLHDVGKTCLGLHSSSSLSPLCHPLSNKKKDDDEPFFFFFFLFFFLSFSSSHQTKNAHLFPSSLQSNASCMANSRPMSPL